MNKHIAYFDLSSGSEQQLNLASYCFQQRTHVNRIDRNYLDNTPLLCCSSAPGGITHFRLTAIRVMSPNFIGLASGSSASYLQLAILMRQFNFRISFGKNDKTPRAKLPLWAGRSPNETSPMRHTGCTMSSPLDVITIHRKRNGAPTATERNHIYPRLK